LIIALPSGFSERYSTTSCEAPVTRSLPKLSQSSGRAQMTPRVWRRKVPSGAASPQGHWTPLAPRSMA
jgi:hypothetical protein